MENSIENYLNRIIVGDTIIVERDSIYTTHVGIVKEIVEPFTKYHSRFTHYVYFSKHEPFVGFTKDALKRYIHE